MRLSLSLTSLDATSKPVDWGKEGHQKRRSGQLNGLLRCLLFWGWGGAAARLLWRKHGSNSCAPSGNIVVLVRSLLVTFHVVPVYEWFDTLFQITRLQKERQKQMLISYWRFADIYQIKRIRRYATLTGNFSWLYSSDTSRLWLRVFRIFMMRTTAASIWYCRSWNTRSVVLTCSSTCSENVWPF